MLESQPFQASNKLSVFTKKGFLLHNIIQISVHAKAGPEHGRAGRLPRAHARRGTFIYMYMYKYIYYSVIVILENKKLVL